MGEDIERTLGRILATQELIIKKLDVHESQYKVIDTRVNSLEGHFRYAAGIAAVAIMFVSVSASRILDWIQGK